MTSPSAYAPTVPGETNQNPEGNGSQGGQTRVLVNAMAMQVGGGGTYIVEQLAALALQPGIDITAVASPEIAGRIRAACGPPVKVHGYAIQGVARRFAFEQLVLPWRARHFDVVYEPCGFAMFASPRPQVVTNQNPHHFPASARVFWRSRYPRALRWKLAIEWRVAHASVRRAEAFLLVSEAFKAMAEEDVGRRSNIHLLRSAAPNLTPPDSCASRSVLEGLPEPYVLTVAHDYFHKDWDGLIRAFQEHPDLPALVVVGACRDDTRERALNGLIDSGGDAQRIRLLGPVRDRERLAALYRGARCFLAHSFLEAGPLTPGEAKRFGLNLVASDIPPHREAGGFDARYYDPHSTDALAAAVRASLADEPRGAADIHDLQWTWVDNAEALASHLRAVAGKNVQRQDVALSVAETGSVGRYYVGGQGAAYYEYQRHTGDLGATLNRWKFQDHIRPADVVVDFGCGGGGLLANLPGATKVGIDANPHAREASRMRGVEAVAATGDLGDGFADVVISNHALEHTLSPLEELRELRRILKSTGKLVLWLPLEDWRQPHHKLRGRDANHHLYGWTPLLLTNLLAEAGFVTEHCQVVTSAWPGRFTKYLHRLPGPIWKGVCRVFSFLKRRRQLMAVARPQAHAPRS